MTTRREPCDRAAPAFGAFAGPPGPLTEPVDEAGDEQADELRASLVRQALAASLTDKQREVIELHFFEGLSQGEIARRLGITQQVVQKRLYGASRNGRLVGGAIARLREALSPHLAELGVPAR